MYPSWPFEKYASLFPGRAAANSKTRKLNPLPRFIKARSQFPAIEVWSLVFLFNLRALADFHAYLGYEFTHTLGIETNSVRITGVFITHNRGTRLPYPIATTRFAPFPYIHPVANPCSYYPVASARKVEIPINLSKRPSVDPAKPEDLRHD